MKPIKLVMQAFGPYPGKEEVDFDNLSKAGIFLIKGPTGSGKTTIFDAMSMALYGKSTGEEDKNKGGRNNLEVWRCNQADWGTETIVEFTFSANNNIYQFKRRLVPKVKKLDSVYSVCIKDKEGNYQPLEENPKESYVNAKAEEIIGLNSNQFRQVVLLPQGKFERFLTADSNEKEQILSRLFDVEQWGKYTAMFFERADKRLAALKKLKEEVDISLKEENAEFTKVDSLEELILSKKSELDEVEDGHSNFNAEEKKKLLKEEQDLASEYKKLHELEKKKEEYEAQKEEIEDEKERLVNAEKAETVREPIKAMEEHKKNLEDVKSECETLNNKTDKLKKDKEDSAEAFERFVKTSPVDDLNSRITTLSNKKELYEKLDDNRAGVAKAKSEKIKVAAEQEKKKANLDQCTEEARKKKDKYDKAIDTAKDYRDRYFKGIYGEIAEEKLEEGMPCPVCGSTHHPAKAEKLEDSVSKEMMEEAEKEAEDAKREWEDAEQKRKEAENELRDCTDALKTAENDEKLAITLYEESAKGLVEGLNSLEDLENKIDELKNEILKINTTKEKLEKIKGEAHDALSRHMATLDAKKKDCADAEEKYLASKKEMDDLLEKHGYENVESAKKNQYSASDRKKMQEDITSYETNIKSNKEDINRQNGLLSGKTEPDVNTFEERQNEIDNENNQYVKRSAELNGEIKRIEHKYSELKNKMKRYDTDIQEAESDWAFAKKLRGDSGIGLQRYVLGIMFNQIIAEANSMLEMVHGGRYQLFRTDEKGSGNKRGLELLVHDNRKPEEQGRPVNSLSGGEKFLVSLSLSIGMSAVAQKSGLHIEALFIDEGFGTLDETSISNAMDILECVQKSNGMIGIISHVAVLESTISKHVEIVKSENGSSIRMC